MGDSFSGDAATISNNLIYANTSYGIVVHHASNATRIFNNTVYQTAGDALHFQDFEQRGAVRTTSYGRRRDMISLSQPTARRDLSAITTICMSPVLPKRQLAKHRLSDAPDVVSFAGFDGHGISVDPQFVNPAGVDGILGYSNGADHGGDDNFALATTRQALMRGGSQRVSSSTNRNPTAGESTSEAMAIRRKPPPVPIRFYRSSAPNGLNELTVGTPTTISWNGSGSSKSTLMGLIDAGGPAAGNFVRQYLSDGQLQQFNQQCSDRHQPGRQSRATAGLSDIRLCPGESGHGDRL